MSALTTKEPTSQLLRRLAPGSPNKSGGGCFPALEEKLRPFRQFNLDHAAKEGVLQSSRARTPRLIKLKTPSKHVKRPWMTGSKKHSVNMAAV